MSKNEINKTVNFDRCTKLHCRLSNIGIQLRPKFSTTLTLLSGKIKIDEFFLISDVESEQIVAAQTITIIFGL